MIVLLLHFVEAKFIVLSLFVAAVGFVLARHLISDRARAKQIGEQFAKHGLDYLGSALPKSLPISYASFWRSGDKVSNLVVGVLNGVETSVCDFHADRGKHGYVQTVIALKLGHVDVSSTLWSGYHLQVEKVGDWIMIFKPKTKLPIAEIEPLIADSRRLAQSMS